MLSLILDNKARLQRTLEIEPRSLVSEWEPVIFSEQQWYFRKITQEISGRETSYGEAISSKHEEIRIQTKMTVGRREKMNRIEVTFWI